MPFFSFFRLQNISYNEGGDVMDIKSEKYRTIEETLRTIGDVCFSIASVYYLIRRIRRYKNLKRGE